MYVSFTILIKLFKQTLLIRSDVSILAPIAEESPQRNEE